MSRCFPYPSSNSSRKDAPQVGSIKKLHNECGNAKHGREENREDEKNKKKNVYEKEKSKKRTRQRDKLDHSAHKKIMLRHDQGSEFLESFRDWKKDASDEREGSGLTEEQELPSSIPNSCTSLDSIKNSSKKKKLLVTDMKRKYQGLVLRIKLPPMKHKEPVTANTNMEPCSSSEAVSVSNITGPSSAGKALKEKPFAKQQCMRSMPATEDPCFSGGGCREMEECFSDLILNWNPSSLQSYDQNPGSQDWLFAPPPPWQSPDGNHNAMSCEASKPDIKVGLVSASSMQPQACYLPEFDIYQLPYVIPF